MAFKAKAGVGGGVLGHRHLGRDRSLTGVQLGEWVCQSQLGTGSFGIVHVWENVNTEEKVALKKCRFGMEVTLSQKVIYHLLNFKVIKLTLMSPPQHKDQWRQEVDIMLRLEHVNVVRCRVPPPELSERFVPTEEDLPLLCMEFCSGGDLRRILNLPHNCCGLPQQQVMAIVSDLTSALGT
jgi:serine/threonine protein kinase